MPGSPGAGRKTLTLRTLAAAWAADGNTVIGLAPTAAAARVLRDELGNSVTATDTLAKLVHALTTGRAVPDWVEVIGPGSLVIVDEAGMAGTLGLAAVIEFAAARGASVRLVGDDRQLAAVGAGGVLRDIDRTRGAVTLSGVRRFTHADGSTNHAEAAASLAIRRGEPDSRTTSTTAASTSATTPPQPIRHSPPGRPTVPPASTHCSSRSPTTRSGN